MMAAEFGTIGVGRWFRHVTGLIKICGALLLIRAGIVFYGAGLLTAVSLGAFIAQPVLKRDPCQAQAAPSDAPMLFAASPMIAME
jgi:hypothetical protein